MGLRRALPAGGAARTLSSVLWGSPRNVFNVGLIGHRVKKTPPPLAHEALVEGNQVGGGRFAVAAGYQLVLNLLAFT